MFAPGPEQPDEPGRLRLEGQGGGYEVWEDRAGRLWTGGRHVPACFFVATRPEATGEH